MFGLGDALWTNVCCSHPREGEYIETFIRKRVLEELIYQILYVMSCGS